MRAYKIKAMLSAVATLVSLVLFHTVASNTWQMTLCLLSCMVSMLLVAKYSQIIESNYNQKQK